MFEGQNILNIQQLPSGIIILNLNMKSTSLNLHADPRQWSRDHVTLWLLHAGVQYQLGDTHPERFPMNGKALLLMSREMFLSRVPEGGGILFEDIQLKLQKVITELYEKASVCDTPPPSSEHK